MKKFLLFFIASGLLLPSLFAQWTQINSASNRYYTDIISRNDTLYSASLNNGVYKSTDGTVSWQQVSSGLNNTQAMSVAQVLLTGNTLYAATTDGIYKSVNGGANWEKKSTGIVVGGGAIYAFTESIFDFNSKLFTGAYTGIYFSTNGGESWQVTNISGSAVMAKNFTVHNGMLFAARETNNTPAGYQSTDNGVTWNPITTYNYPMITFLSEGTNLWAGTIDGVWLSTNNGAGWIQRSTGLSADPYSSSIIRVNGTLVTSLKFGGSGMYRSSNDGVNWENIGTGLPFLQSIEKLITYNGKIIAATSQGLWQRNISEIVVGAGNQGNETPQSYQLFQNYPNPFNPGTVISYELRVTSFVRLDVFDISGKHIANLVNKKEDAGSYSIDFSGDGLPSGIYLYRLTAGDFTETKKMILLK